MLRVPKIIKKWGYQLVGVDETGDQPIVTLHDTHTIDGRQIQVSMPCIHGIDPMLATMMQLLNQGHVVNVHVWSYSNEHVIAGHADMGKNQQ